jgi:hypothetical protein
MESTWNIKTVELKRRGNKKVKIEDNLHARERRSNPDWPTRQQNLNITSNHQIF